MKLERKTTLVEKDLNAGKRLQKIDSIVADLTEWVNNNTNRIEVKPGNNGFYVIPAQKKLFEFKVVYNEDETLNFSAIFDTKAIYEKNKFAYDDFDSAIAESLEECHKHFITGKEAVLREFVEPDVLGKTGLFGKIANAINKKAVDKQNEKDLKATVELIKNDLETALKEDDYLKATTLNANVNGREINCVAEFAYIIAASFAQAGTDVTNVTINKIFNVLYPEGKAIKVKKVDSFINLLEETLKTKPNLNNVEPGTEEPEETPVEEKPTETTEEPKPEETVETTAEETPAEETPVVDPAKAKFKKLRAQARKNVSNVDYKEFIKAFADIDLKSDKNKQKIIDTIMSMYPSKKKPAPETISGEEIA